MDGARQDLLENLCIGHRIKLTGRDRHNHSLRGFSQGMWGSSGIHRDVDVNEG
jgi:hypothetical protein